MLSHHIKATFKGKFNLVNFFKNNFRCFVNEFKEICGIIHFSISHSLAQWISPTLLITISMYYNYDN